MVNSERGMLKQIEIATDDNGNEVVWGENRGDAIELLSVPVFAYGVSRGAIISADGDGDKLRFRSVLRLSRGATVRCYVAEHVTAGKVYQRDILAETAGRGLHLGPATIFDPQLVALHIASRTQLLAVSRFLDELVQRSILKFWELADPTTEHTQPALDCGPALARWELIHPLPVEGPPALATMH